MHLTKQKTLLTVLFIIVILYSCTNNAGVGITQKKAKEKTETAQNENIKYASVHRDVVEERIEENIEDIKLSLTKLNQKLVNHKNDISDKARLNSYKFKKDLERLKKDLSFTLDSLNAETPAKLEETRQNVQNSLEQAEDELSQINDELKEWYDKNIK